MHKERGWCTIFWCTTSQYLGANGFLPFWHQLQYDMLVRVPVGGVGGGGGGSSIVKLWLVACIVRGGLREMREGFFLTSATLVGNQASCPFFNKPWSSLFLARPPCCPHAQYSLASWPWLSLLRLRPLHSPRPVAILVEPPHLSTLWDRNRPQPWRSSRTQPSSSRPSKDSWRRRVSLGDRRRSDMANSLPIPMVRLC